MDIGTAKVSAVDRARIAHHGLDLVDPDEPFSVADFATHARTALEGIAARGGIAILVGGTGFYLRAVGRGLDLDALPSDPFVRAAIQSDLERGGLGPAIERLRLLAPTLAEGVDLRNPRRVERALEIATLQGDRPLPEPRGYPGPTLWLALTVEASMHRRWIAERAANQFSGGLLEEAAALRRRYPAALRPFTAIGYPEAFSVLEGRADVPSAVAATVRRTIAFGKRQRTWFRREPGVAWLDATEDAFPDALEITRGFLDRAG